MTDGSLIIGDGSGGGGGGGGDALFDPSVGGQGGDGGGSNDTLIGTSDNDVIIGDGAGGGAGGGDRGTVEGGAGGGGDDIINGGDGDDIMFGDGFNGGDTVGGGGSEQNFGAAGGAGGGGGGGGDDAGGFFSNNSDDVGGSGSSALGGDGGDGGDGGLSAIDGTAGGDGSGLGNSGGGGGGLGGGEGGDGGGLGAFFNNGRDGGDGNEDVLTGAAGTANHDVVKANLDAIADGSYLGTGNGTGAGNDVLDGGAGSDDYLGMGGSDTFIVDLADNDAGNDTDTLWDFDRSESDLIQLENGGSNILTTEQIEAILNNQDGALGSTSVSGSDTTITFTNGSSVVINDTTDLTSADFVPCFLTGTQVATATGNTAVEALHIGDDIIALDGSVHKVKWIGQRGVSPIFAQAELQNPICISAGALAENVPARDLHVSRDHALYIDDVLVQAHALVNGSSIYQIEKMTESFTYWHIELDSHQLILAEGAATESFVDNDARGRYDNAAEFDALYPNAKPMAEMPIARIKSKRQLSQKTKQQLSSINRLSA